MRVASMAGPPLEPQSWNSRGRWQRPDRAVNISAPLCADARTAATLFSRPRVLRGRLLPPSFESSGQEGPVEQRPRLSELMEGYGPGRRRASCPRNKCSITGCRYALEDTLSRCAVRSPGSLRAVCYPLKREGHLANCSAVRGLTRRGLARSARPACPCGVIPRQSSCGCGLPLVCRSSLLAELSATNLSICCDRAANTALRCAWPSGERRYSYSALRIRPDTQRAKPVTRGGCDANKAPRPALGSACPGACGAVV